VLWVPGKLPLSYVLSDNLPLHLIYLILSKYYTKSAKNAPRYIPSFVGVNRKPYSSLYSRTWTRFLWSARVVFARNCHPGWKWYNLDARPLWCFMSKREKGISFRCHRGDSLFGSSIQKKLFASDVYYTASRLRYIRCSSQLQVNSIKKPYGCSLQRVAAALTNTIRYDTRCYFNVRSKADMNRLNLPHGDDNWKL